MFLFLIAEKILQIGGIDYVIGSLHSLKGKEDFYFWDFKKEKEHIDEALTCYFKQMLEMVQWGKFDTLAHITYPIRYISGDYHIPVDLQKYSGQIDEIFRLLIEKEIALELNTSGFRQAIGDSLPPRALLERYYKMGGKIVDHRL